EFGAGGLASLALWPQRMSAPACARLGWFGLLLVSASVLFISSDSVFPGWVAIIPVAGTCSMLIAGATSKTGVTPALSSAPLLRLGSLSYSWYLWHWPFLVFAQLLFPELSTTGRIGAALLALATAALSYRFVENPLRYNPVLVRRPFVSLAAGA